MSISKSVNGFIGHILMSTSTSNSNAKYAQLEDLVDLSIHSEAACCLGVY